MRALLGMLIKRRIAGAGPASGRKKGAHAGVASPAHPAACFRHAAACLAPLQACTTAKPRRWACRDPGSNRGPSDLQSDALPAELSRLVGKVANFRLSLAAPPNGAQPHPIFWHEALASAAAVAVALRAAGADGKNA